MKRLRRLPRWLFLLIVAVLIIGIVTWQQLQRRLHPAAQNTITGNGVIEATEVDLSSKVPGRILKLFVDEGYLLYPGELIAILDRNEQRGQLVASKGATVTAKENLAALQAGSRPQEIQSAQAQYDAAVSNLRQAEARLSLAIAGSRPEEIAQARAALQQTQANLSLVLAGPRPEAIAQLRAQYAQAQANLSLLHAGTRIEEINQNSAALTQAKATAANAETELKRAQYLFDQGAIPAEQRDTARTQRDVAEAQVHAAEQRLIEARRGPRPQEIQQAAAAAEAVRQQLLAAEAGSRPQEIAAARAQVAAAEQHLREEIAGSRPQEIEEAHGAVAQAAAQAQSARAALELAILGPRKENIGAGKGTLQQASGNQQTAQSVLNQTKIYAPRSGRVTLRAAEPGDVATVGMPIIRFDELDTVWLRVYVPEEQVGWLKLGQRAVVTTDAFPNRHYQGKVTQINETPEFTPKNVQTKDERTKLVFGVKVTVNNPNQELKAGMPGDATIYVR